MLLAVKRHVNITFTATDVPSFAGGKTVLWHDLSLEGWKQSCIFHDINFSEAQSDEFIENKFAFLMEYVVNR